MKIVSGKTGTPHVTSEQFRQIIEGTIGQGSYILTSGENLEPELSSNNMLKIRGGMMSHHGNVSCVELNTYDEVTLTNGSQGVKRIDLIVNRYTRNDETGLEKNEWVVIIGTPDATNPKVPEYIAGNLKNGDLTDDCPVFEVHYDGINVTEVKKLLPVMSNLDLLNGKIEKPTLYSVAEKQIGVTDSGEPIYRKTIRAAMTYFSKPSSGYADCTISFGAYLKKILRADAHIVKNDNTEMYALPYSATGGSWGTWLRSISSSGSQQSVLHFNNNVTWGSAYTLVVTIDYTK